MRYFELAAELEEELLELSPEEQAEFMRDYGLEALAYNRFIRAAYEMMRLITFYTTVSDDLRAWPLPQGSTALEAAGKIHTDMQRGFVRAEVIGFDDFVECGSLAEARHRGKVRLEGKEYEVQDGDIITFRFSV